MANTKTTVAIEKRDVGGSASRRLRREGKVPAVVYGGHRDPVSVSVHVKDLDHALSESRVVNLKGAGVTGQVIVRDLDVDPVSGHVRHVDFQRVERGKTMHASIHVVVSDEDVVLKKGLITSWNLDEIEVEGLPASIPEEIEITLGGFEPGDSLVAGELPLPKGVKLLTAKDDIVLTVVAPTVSEQEEEPVPEEEDAGEPA